MALTVVEDWQGGVSPAPDDQAMLQFKDLETQQKYMFPASREAALQFAEKIHEIFSPIEVHKTMPEELK